MTNYNERLDELEEQFLADYRNWNDGLWDYNGLDTKQKFHQALTSLIKELVAEAKPAHVHGTTVGSGQFNRGVSEFEQNLLKALDEV